MKIIKLFICTAVVFMIFAFSTCYGQSGPVYDNFADRSQIYIQRSNSTAQVQYGYNTAQIISEFGSPDNTTSDYWEMSEQNVINYHYNDGLELSIVDDTLNRIAITSDNYALKLGTHIIKVGNHKSTLQQYTLSYNSFKNGSTAITLDYGDHEYYLIKHNLILSAR